MDYEYRAQTVTEKLDKLNDLYGEVEVGKIATKPTMIKLENSINLLTKSLKNFNL